MKVIKNIITLAYLGILDIYLLSLRKKKVQLMSLFTNITIGFPEYFTHFLSIFIQTTMQFLPKKCPRPKVDISFKFTSSSFQYCVIIFQTCFIDFVPS